MKKIIVGIVIGALLTLPLSFALAEDGLAKIEAYLRPNLPITLNGQAITLENSPIMYDGNTYVKLRDIQKVDPNLKVNWNDSTQTVELSIGATSVPVSSNAPQSTPVPTPTNNIKEVENMNVFEKLTVESKDVEFATVNGVKGVKYNGETYFSAVEFERDNFKDGKYNGKTVWVNDWQTRVMTFYITETETIQVNLSDIKNIVIVDGQSFLNAEYFPK